MGSVLPNLILSAVLSFSAFRLTLMIFYSCVVFKIGGGVDLLRCRVCLESHIGRFVLIKISLTFFED